MRYAAQAAAHLTSAAIKASRGSISSPSSLSKPSCCWGSGGCGGGATHCGGGIDAATAGSGTGAGATPCCCRHACSLARRAAFLSSSVCPEAPAEGGAAAGATASDPSVGLADGGCSSLRLRSRERLRLRSRRRSRERERWRRRRSRLLDRLRRRLSRDLSLLLLLRRRSRERLRERLSRPIGRNYVSAGSGRRKIVNTIYVSGACGNGAPASSHRQRRRHSTA